MTPIRLMLACVLAAAAVAYIVGGSQVLVPAQVVNGANVLAWITNGSQVLAVQVVGGSQVLL